MSEDQSRKTAKPTPKRIKDFRKRGEIAISKEIVQTAAMLGGMFGLALYAPRSAAAVAELTQSSIRYAGVESAPSLTDLAASAFIACVAPAAIGAIGGALVAGAAQLGWPPAFKTPKFELGKLFSAESIKRMISPKQAAGRVLKATAKVAFVGLAVVLAISGEIDRFMSDPSVEPTQLASRVGGALLRLGAYAVCALAAMAALDYIITRKKLWDRMKMTPEELKREHKDSEGDPMVRAKRKRKMRELARRRLAAEVPKADVVLVNPTHYAVALRYDGDKDGAPRVVAKGTDEVAAKIRELARGAGVPVISRPPLTRLIHKLVKEGAEIPAELYQVIAEILAYVYRLRSGGDAGGAPQAPAAPHNNGASA